MMHKLMPKSDLTTKEFLKCKLFKPYAPDEEHFQNMTNTNIFDQNFSLDEILKLSNQKLQNLMFQTGEVDHHSALDIHTSKFF